MLRGNLDPEMAWAGIEGGQKVGLALDLFEAGTVDYPQNNEVNRTSLGRTTPSVFFY
jgi:hypothetical protein